jgi:hypothetical protein
MNQRIDTLWDGAIPAEAIPEYPGLELLKAKGSEETYDVRFRYIPDFIKNELLNSPIARDQWKEFYSEDKVLSPDNPMYEGVGPIVVFKRKAKKGEYILDKNLRRKFDWRKNLEYRASVLAKAADNPAYQKLQIALCKSSITYFVNTFCWTYDPRRIPEDPSIPLVTMPFQDDMLKFCVWLIKEGQTGAIEKSREMGASWLAVEAISVWQSIFYKGAVDYQLSMNEDDVDSKSNKSLLGKFRFLMNHLPDWMKQGWYEGKNGCDIKMEINIPDTGATIYGALTKGTAGRSGRGTRAAYDEFAFIQDSSSVLMANSSLADSELFLSTVNGMDNEFARITHDKASPKLTLHWSLHSLKTILWAIKERSKTKYTTEIWAQEHEINYETSTSGRVFPQFTSFSPTIYSWGHVKDQEPPDDFYEYDPHYDVYVGMDFGMRDPTTAAFAQIKPAPLHFHHKTKECLVFFREFQHSNWIVDQWADFLKRFGYRYASIIGDQRTGNQRDSRGKTWISNFALFGVRINGIYNSADAPILEVQRRLLIEGGVAVNKKNCPFIAEAFQNWSYPTDQDGRVIQGAKPKHDKYSHMMKGICYMIDWIYGNKKKKKGNEIKEEEWEGFNVLDDMY